MAPLTRPTLPAWNLTPFRGHWPVTDLGDPSYPEATVDRQPMGREREGWSELLTINCVLKRRGAFRSYLCNAASTSLIISLISMTRLPDGLERRSSSCLNWLRQRTWCCNYRGDWRQRLPLLIKYSCCPHDGTAVEGQWLPPCVSNTFKTFSEPPHRPQWSSTQAIACEQHASFT